MMKHIANNRFESPSAYTVATLFSYSEIAETLQCMVFATRILNFIFCSNNGLLWKTPKNISKTSPE